MKFLEEKIRDNAKILDGSVLKVDSFLTHQIDTGLIEKCADEWHRLFENDGVTKILTIESAGIGIAAITATRFGVPLLFAKKTSGSFEREEYLSAKIVSFTHGREYSIVVPRDCLKAGERILILDDFIATASAMKALITMCEGVGAEVVGCGAVIEKVYRGGGNDMRTAGIRVESLAKISSISDSGIEFC